MPIAFKIIYMDMLIKFVSANFIINHFGKWLEYRREAQDIYGKYKIHKH